MSTRRISVVLPVYNEAENIATSLRGLWAALEGVEHEILVCYDFDADSTLPAIAAMPDAPPTVRLVKNTIGKGAANAIRAGFAAATGDVVVTTMADLSDPPDRIVPMAEKMRAEGLAVVAGSRYMRGGSQTGGPLLKRTFSRWAGLILRTLAGIGTHDVTSNFRAYSRSFLDSTRVESKAGFEIALELTTKAHNAGLGVGEIPSSWQDRSAGTSRFRMWKWMPDYLRWWSTAAVAPLVVWTAWLALSAWSWRRALGAGEPAAIHAAIVALYALGGAAAILALRRARRRTTSWDAVASVLWTHPWHACWAFDGWAAWDVAGTVVATVAYAWIALGTAGFRAACRRARARAARIDQAAVGIVVLAALFVVSRFVGPTPAASIDLDGSWQQIIGNAIARGDQWGRDVVFTFGPLGYFASGTYIPELYWWKVLWWEIGFKSILALGFVAIARRMSGPLERTAYLFTLFVTFVGFDSLYFLAIGGAGLWLLATPAAGTAITAVAFGVMSLLALNKFTSFVLFGVIVAGVALGRKLRGSWSDAASTVALAALVFVASWVAVGQNPLNIPVWIRTSLWIASGHNQAMSIEGPERDMAEAVVLMWLTGGIALLSLLEQPRDAMRWMASGLFTFTLFVAFKAGFTRHGSNCITFFAVAAVAPYLLLPAERPGALARFVRPVLVVARIGGAWLALLTIARLFGNPQAVPTQPLIATISALEHNPGRIASLADRKDRLERMRDASAREWNLPRTREVVGDGTVDLFFFEQGVVMLNGLDFRQSPAIQSYVAYTPELLRLNADHLRGDDAPDFVLYRHSTLDRRLPGLEDGLALRVISRDYSLVHQEKDTLLLRRTPRGAEPPRNVLSERDAVEFGEPIDLRAHGARSLVAEIDLDLSATGKWRQFLVRAPVVWIQVEFETGQRVRYRFEPGMARTGFLISPHVDSTGAAEQFYLGNGGKRVTEFRLIASPEDREGFRPTFSVKVLDATAFDPVPIDPSVYAANRTIARQQTSRTRDVALVDHAAVVTRPELVRAFVDPYPTLVGEEDVLVTEAPCELQFRLPPGERRLRARLCVPEYAWRYGTHTGLGLSVIARDERGKDERLYMRHLDPQHVGADRGFFDLDVAIPADSGRLLLVRVRPGLAEVIGEDLVAWSSISIGE